ncbi:CPA2 family monovalent cation:H+ antiporter-2/glutathione-regulated potassium-efflux system protein KefB [Mesoflavibacter sabulilitoris]|uniref:Potassium transporter n=1 Tax=Mesoflavibacter zeaxanthinifaciens subsp. sabulilitoris TaxID=1520893 RepID=A0A2T1NPM3_9FLAO|nr:monovalent cation:proton antiporter-2 (CPA2) family protein [Mesoflavibacter zeaxanthinifaciens]MBB3125181.1 CPA2 family monovalent cation:H+ antiporter-2/glutathione-regulated potassium-efflux system protein KefB [Mesoflavibacter zeaxanthinifaciens subsp. sabulilitoris]PSG94852.1 potassium transporter [Mesoflavibacter zeaxanthinifaciens subsp. sabulilitoris]
MSGSLLFEAIVFLAGAIICVSIAKRLGLSSVIGYLLAGVLIGPYVFGFIGEEGEDILHFAEFGVVVMLFLIGLEIEPKNFWNMRKSILGMGGIQVALTIGLTYVLFAFLGYEWQVALAIGMAVALSSTAIALQTIKEKGLMKTTFGSSSFSILLFQDIIVIFMIGVLPLLSNSNKHADGYGGHSSSTLIESLPIGLQTLAIILSVVVIVLAGRLIVVPMLRKVAQTGVRELLIAAAFLIVFGISYLMEFVGLSPALGAFLGGVVLSTSEFKHELESTLEPFKNLLLGLFFMAVGASINFVVIANSPLTIGGILIAIIAIKALVLFITGRIFKLKLDQNVLLTFSLAQVGEFAFVLLSFAFQLNILEQEQMDMMLVITAVSMSLTPILAVINERLILPKIGTKESIKRPMDHIAKSQKVILVGFGHFGSTVGRFLRSHGVEATILDFDSNRVDFLRKMGFEVYYGDATREDLLESAGIAEAKLLICATNKVSVAKAISKIVKEKYPHVEMLVRTKNRYDAYELLNLDVTNIYRETLDTSLALASDALNKLGFRKYTLNRQVQNFIKYDEASLRRLASEPKREEDYVFMARKEIEQQEKLLEDDFKRGIVAYDNHWDSEHIRKQLEKSNEA